LDSLFDDVVENVDETVVWKTVGDPLEAEVKGGEAFRDLGAKRMRLLLILFEGRDEELIESVWEELYGLSEERSKPSLEISVLLSSNFPALSLSLPSII
jgi:hypothetical protein